MAKIKFKERMDNAIEAFFDDSKFEPTDLSKRDNASINADSKEISESRFREQFFTIFRQVFLFFPGTFVLWITIAELVYRISSGYFETPPLVLVFLLISYAMVLLGLGDLRRLKDYLIPSSILVVGVVTAVLAQIVPWGLFRFDQFGILLFPLALIAPFIMKFWLDSDD